MILSEIKTMDQKNRTHINQDYLKLLGIEPNSQVKISVNLEVGIITIEKVPEAYKEAIRSLSK